MNKMWWLGVLALAGSALYAQDISGNWQGTLHAGPQDLRLIVEIAKADGGGWKASLFSIDQTTNAIPVSSVTLVGSNLVLTVDAVRGTYEGKLTADGASIAGTWTQGVPLPLGCAALPKKRRGTKIQRRTRSSSCPSSRTSSWRCWIGEAPGAPWFY